MAPDQSADRNGAEASSPEALTPVEVAHILRIAKNTVYELVKRGDLPAYRAGKKMRFELKDVEAYKRNTRTVKPAGTRAPGDFSPHPPIHPALHDTRLPETSGAARPFILCGQDVLLDVLAHHLESRLGGARTARSFLGSFNGLYELYLGNVSLASSHLWDYATDSYTLPFLPHILPGIRVTVIRLVRRTVGFYVPNGNPAGLSSWADLGRGDLQFVNRERGSGIRVLVDGKLFVSGVSPSAMPGYSRVCTTHLVAAATVARGGGDYAIGSEMGARQVSGVSFVPLQEECYDLVFPTENERLPHIACLVERIQSREFREEIDALGGYGTEETGKILRG